MSYHRDDSQSAEDKTNNMNAIKYKLMFLPASISVKKKDSIYAEEVYEVVDKSQFARELSHELNGVINEGVASLVTNALGRVVKYFVEQGYRVPLYDGDKQIVAVYPDVKMAKTFDLAEAKKRGFSGTKLTDQAASLMTASDLKVTVAAEVMPDFAKEFKAAHVGLERTGLVTLTKKATGSGTGSGSGYTPDEDGLGS